MIRIEKTGAGAEVGIPRESGDDPLSLAKATAAGEYSPRERG